MEELIIVQIAPNLLIPVYVYGNDNINIYGIWKDITTGVNLIIVAGSKEQLIDFVIENYIACTMQ